MAQRKGRRVALAVSLLALLAILTDRVSLYMWGLGVRGFYRSLHQNIDSTFRSDAPSPSMPLTEIRWDEIPFMEGEDGPDAVNFMRSGVRPDCIQMNSHGIKLWYLPPRLAWTTRLYPFYSGDGSRPRSYRPVDHYQYMLVMHSSGKWAKPVVELYSGPEQSPVPLSAARPEVFP